MMKYRNDSLISNLGILRNKLESPPYTPLNFNAMDGALLDCVGFMFISCSRFNGRIYNWSFLPKKLTTGFIVLVISMLDGSYLVEVLV